MSALFLVVYGGTNQIAARRGPLPSWVTPLDRHMPFIPALIVPYLSIDLFFVAAPFLCHDRAELRRLAGRMAFAVLVCGAFFLALPLRFAFDRPPGNALFDAFRHLDGPYNQFPSLHIALLTILTVHYHRHARSLLRLGVHTWFALIAASTVLTYQHHLIDLPGGLAVGLLALFLFPTHAGEPHRNRRVSAYYAVAAAGLVVVATFGRPWGSLLLWPALSLGVMAAECAGAPAVPFRKVNGRVAIASRWIMAPVCLGQRISWWHYARRSRPYDRMVDGIILGRVLTAPEAADACAQGVTAVLDLTPDFPVPPPFRAVPYRNVPVPDLTAPTPAELSDAAAFIERHRAAGGTVYVCCKAGYSRSAAVVAAYLVHAGLAPSADAAIAEMRIRRPGLIVRPEAVSAIQFHIQPA